MKAFVAIVCLSVVGLCQGQGIQASGNFQASVSPPSGSLASHAASGMSAMLNGAINGGRVATNTGIDVTRAGILAGLSGLRQFGANLAAVKGGFVNAAANGMSNGLRQGAVLVGGIPVVGNMAAQFMNSQAATTDLMGNAAVKAVGQMSAAKENLLATAEGQVNQRFNEASAQANSLFDQAQAMGSTVISGVGAGIAAGESLAQQGAAALTSSMGTAVELGSAAMQGGAAAANAALQTGLSAAGTAVDSGARLSGSLTGTVSGAASSGSGSLSASGSLSTSGSRSTIQGSGSAAVRVQ